MTLPFLFYIFKKNQNFKNMWLFQEIAKMGPCRSWVGDRPPVAQATGDRDLSVFFFFEQVPGGGRGAGGPVAPPTGDRAGLPYLNPPSPLTPHSIL